MHRCMHASSEPDNHNHNNGKKEALSSGIIAPGSIAKAFACNSNNA